MGRPLESMSDGSRGARKRFVWTITDPVIYMQRCTHRMARKKETSLTRCIYEDLIVVEAEIRGAVS